LLHFDSKITRSCHWQTDTSYEQGAKVGREFHCLLLKIFNLRGKICLQLPAALSELTAIETADMRNRKLSSALEDGAMLGDDVLLANASGAGAEERTTSCFLCGA
jgi:hypothetical protein